ncbi:MAG: tRNA (adenosine(37)-N6)-threonylcarbamoyltransferase complex ATPase subunit type 1 TsaE [Treponema sp.]|nr:tRNA (adenosine(37)-N6)-threonylcarbamoyltransferase complex ATPase subunit type 1 TsaE [Treponema sp.]MCL2236831.1 tRNA (adenosine(37)-N6)-threonylcarbamoyltransferase complex ATPase subunit type 1 TsaE [Treponema sp.]
MIEVTSASPDETHSIGKKIASRLFKGSVVTLNGVLGSGKTALSKGIASGLGIKENITSPTYTIINEYANDASIVLYHIDAYRLSGEKDFEDTGGVEILNSGGICLIEWSERILKSLPQDCINIYIEITGECSRLIRIDGIEKL